MVDSWTFLSMLEAANYRVETFDADAAELIDPIAEIDEAA